MFILKIFLHMAPMMAGAGLSIYQQGGVHIVKPGQYQLKQRSHLSYMAPRHRK